MYNKILVPLDGSKLSEGVLPYVRSLARTLNVPVEFLYVHDPLDLTPYSTIMQSGEYLEGAAASFFGITDVKCAMEMGSAASTIVDLAAKQAGTLIAMATHGYSGARRWLLGSVAEKVLHAATSHLLLVRAADQDTSGEVQLKRVLVPLDGSDLAEKVLPPVIELASRANLEVLLLRVAIRVYSGSPDALLPVFGANIANLKELWAEAKLETERYLAEKVQQLRAEELPHVSCVSVESGADGAAGEIIELARKTPDSLVAMSTHGRSGVGRWVLGSVTERVVRHSSAPVLVIRSQA
jgi:nucleotide-binding universal stress UspA family protein